MVRKRYKPEEIVGLLRQAEVLHGQGMSMVNAIRQLWIRTHDRPAFRTLNILDEFTRESLAIRVRRKLSSADVSDVVTDLP